MRRSVTLALLAPSVACITISGSVATPTAVEHQLLGVYRELDRDLVYASSVRGDVVALSGSFESLRALALEGRALQKFNEDDLDELKASGCIAERRDSTVTQRECADVPQSRLTRVVADENAARAAILKWAAYAYARESGRQNPSQAEMDDIRQTYRRLLREAAKSGHLFEASPGRFEKVTE